MKEKSVKHHKNSVLGVATLLPLLPLLAAAPQAWAQDEAAAAAPAVTATVPVDETAAPAEGEAAAAAPATHGSIEEIVVTAQKREENLQDVPIAISAFSAEQLETQGASTTKGLAQMTPGLTITELAGYTFIYLRGVGSDAFVASADPSVATYVDGLYTPIGHGFAQELGNVERVEVLKGPQGTLFGRNSTGGAISVTTKKPGNTFENSASLSYGSFNTYAAKFYTSIPLSDSLAFSVSALQRGAESYYDREGPRADRGIANDNISGARGRVRWNPSDETELLLTAQRVNIRAPGSLVSANRLPSPLLGSTVLQIQPTEEDYVTRGDTDSRNDAYQTSYYGSFTWQLPWFDVKLLGEKLLNDATALQTDFDGSAEPLVSFFSGHEYTNLKTAELQFLSNQDSWGSDWLTWVGGFFYLKSDAGFDPVQLQVANSIVQLPTGELLDLLPAGVRQRLGAVPAPSSIDVYLVGLIETESTSAFAQTTAKITDQLSLTLGGRYQNETRRQSKSTVQLANVADSETTLLSYAPQEKTVKNFSPKVTIDYHLGGDTLLYTSWSQGFKSQTYNIINIYTPPDYIKPEKLTSYEAGIKSSLFDNTMRINAAVFQNETKNLQSSFISLLAGGAVRLENAGSARSRGVELDLLWLPLSDIDPGLTFTFGAAYLDAIYTSFKDGSGFNDTPTLLYPEGTGLQQGGQDFTGNRITRTPKWTGNVALTQTIETASGPLDVGVDYYYSDSFYFLPQNGSRSYEPSYGLLGAHVSYMISSWGLKLSVYGANLTDEQYNIAQFHTDFGRNDTQAPPRNYGVRVNWDF